MRIFSDCKKRLKILLSLSKKCPATEDRVSCTEPKVRDIFSFFTDKQTQPAFVVIMVKITVKTTNNAVKTIVSVERILSLDAPLDFPK